MATDCLGRFANQRPFILLVQIALPFGIGPAMADDLVAPLADAFKNRRRIR